MKKLLAVLAVASVTMGSMAQDSATTEKYSVATNSFWSNWFATSRQILQVLEYTESAFLSSQTALIPDWSKSSTIYEDVIP